MTIFRRLVLLWLFMFWQGGFVFYGAVVVTIGSRVLESDRTQGFITRQVAVAMNVTGALVLLAWLWDLCAERASRLRQRWAIWVFLALTLAALTWLHLKMDAHLDPATHRITQGDEFHHLHRWYLRISTLQWLASIAFTYWTLQNWRAADRRHDAATMPVCN